MKNQIAAIVGWFLLLIVFGIYLYGIYYAIANTQLPGPFDALLSSIGAILLTNLGAVLGISVTNLGSSLAQLVIPGSTRSIEIPDPLSQREIIQYVSLIIYLLVLVVCFAVWIKSGFANSEEPNKIASIVEQNAKILFGVITAYIALILGATK